MPPYRAEAQRRTARTETPVGVVSDARIRYVSDARRSAAASSTPQRRCMTYAAAPLQKVHILVFSVRSCVRVNFSVCVWLCVLCVRGVCVRARVHLHIQ